jgi:hypothetical protein
MKPDPNTEAARIVRETTRCEDQLPLDVEAAWQGWSKRIQGVDERVRTLLRAAFEAGVEVGAAGGKPGKRDSGA